MECFEHSCTGALGNLHACTGKSTKEAQPGSWANQELGFPEVNLPGESHGQRSLVNYSPWGPKESHTTERPALSF